MTFDVEVTAVVPASPIQAEMEVESSEPQFNASVDAPKSQFLAELNSYDFIAAATLPHPPNYRALSISADPEVKKLLAAYSYCRNIMTKRDVIDVRDKLKPANQELKYARKKLDNAEVKAAARAQSKKPGRKPTTVKQRQIEYDAVKEKFDECVEDLDTIESELYALAKDACGSYIEIAKKYENNRIQPEAQKKTSSTAGSSSSNDVVHLTPGQRLELQLRETVDFSKLPPIVTNMSARQWIRAKEAAERAKMFDNLKKRRLDGIPKSISQKAHTAPV
ncbi:hypothetical protein GQ42DRAFT_170667 [Ramicandelaber brevisporus]|nr:hypothetical protein GQ42DRAFT_170667 [Ramicandelaber brevisporus]